MQVKVSLKNTTQRVKARPQESKVKELSPPAGGKEAHSQEFVAGKSAATYIHTRVRKTQTNTEIAR